MINYKQAKERLNFNKEIEICEDEYNGWASKSKFYDKIIKKYFWAIPYNIRKNTTHPQRNKNKITFKIAKERLMGNKDVFLCQEEYYSWTQKAKFWDNIEKDYFWSIPRDVLKNNSGHPNRRKKKVVEKLSLTFEKAQQKLLSQRNDIVLCEDGWNGWSKKSKFFDKIIGEYWWALPYSVYSQKSNHPKRYKKDKKTLEVALKKFESQRDDIVLCKNEWNGWSFKSKFYDKKAKEYFYAIPKTVFKNKSNHSNLKWKKAVKTSIKNNNGIYHLLKKDIKEKREASLRKKYNSISPFTSEKIRKKIKKQNNEKYGVDYPFESLQIRNKIKKTCLERYGTEYYMQSEKAKEKFLYNITKYYIKETNEPVKTWLDNFKGPKPSYTSLVHTIQKIDKFEYKTIKIATLEKIITNYGNHKTTLEALGEILFETEHYNRKPKEIKSVYRPDFKLSPQIFVNVDGLYWHSERQKDKWDHFNLRKEFEENGLRIFQFHENEIRYKPQIVKSIINNSLGKTKNKIFARKCKIEKVSQKEATEFLNQNHLMGSMNAKHIGLYFEEQLVSIISWKCRKNICKIERFCSKIDYSVIGGFSKLLNHLEKKILEDQITEIYNWVDLRYGTGKHLLDKYFSFEKETLGWKWTDREVTYNRLKCRANMDKRRLSQQEHANELDWCKIYDAGQRLYTKHIKQNIII